MLDLPVLFTCTKLIKNMMYKGKHCFLSHVFIQLDSKNRQFFNRLQAELMSGHLSNKQFNKLLSQHLRSTQQDDNPHAKQPTSPKASISCVLSNSPITEDPVLPETLRPIEN